MTPEKRFETKIKNYIDSIGGWQVKFFANAYTKSGIPDLLCCINGYFVGIEVKADRGTPSELQLHNIRQIKKAGGFAFVVYPTGYNKLVKILNDLKRGYFENDIEEVLK